MKKRQFDYISNSIPYGQNIKRLREKDRPSKFSRPLASIVEKTGLSPLDYVEKRVESLNQLYLERYGETKWVSVQYLAKLTSHNIRGSYVKEWEYNPKRPFYGRSIIQDERKDIFLAQGLHIEDYRITVAHEIIHDFFRDEKGERPDRDMPKYDEEFLCEYGAALLLLPMWILKEYCSTHDLNIASQIRVISGKQNIPIKNTIQRVISHSIEPFDNFDTAILWEKSNNDIVTNWSCSTNAFIPRKNKCREESIVKKLYDRFESSDEFLLLEQDRGIESVEIGGINSQCEVDACGYNVGRRDNRTYRVLALYNRIREQ